ncbi:S41 family peptidase [Aquimarina sp. W85]|uniref:S41 family peptidase n=1 Tax=Aquimarina rhodophyticola TaxID=3342246 RepID=UPI0036727CEA
MILKHFLIVSLFFVQTLFYGQTNKAVTSYKNDLKIFKTILEQGHPNLHQYIQKKQLDSLFNILLKDSDKSSQLGFLKNLYQFSDAIQDGHIEIYPPTNLVANSYHFPLILKIIQGKAYNYAEHTSIPSGSLIQSVNGIAMEQILMNLKKYIPSDGHLTQTKERGIEQKFDGLYTLEYGATKNYEIEFIDSFKITKKIILPAVKQTDLSVWLNLLDPKPDPFVKNKVSPIKHNTDKIFFAYDAQKRTAFLKIESFAMGSQNFNKSLDQIFFQLKKDKIINLIIDIRQNKGGNRANTIRLMSYITTGFFKQRKRAHVGTLAIPAKEYAMGSYFEEELNLKEKFKNHPVYNGWTSNFDDLEPMMVPSKNRFTGGVYVLIDGSTQNEASDFALLAKNDTNITLVGEETGCTFHTHNIGLRVFYELPTSGIQFSFHMKNVQNFVKSQLPTNTRGVVPNRFIPFTINDIISCKDSQLLYVLKLVTGNNTTHY